MDHLVTFVSTPSATRNTLLIIILSLTLNYIYKNVTIFFAKQFSVTGIVSRYRAKRSFLSRVQSSGKGKLVGHIQQLNIYPIKSCKRVTIEEMKFDSLGPAGDRCLMCVRCDDLTALNNSFIGDSKVVEKIDQTKLSYRFFSQRQSPALATITVTLLPNSSPGTTAYMLSSPYMKDDLIVTSPPNVSRSDYRAGQILNAKVWDDDVTLIDHGTTCSNWMTKLVDKFAHIEDTKQKEVVTPSNDDNDDDDDDDDDETFVYPRSIFGVLKLGSMTPTHDRRVELQYTPALSLNSNGLPPLTTFSDGFPILLTTSCSMDDLNERMMVKNRGVDGAVMSLGMERFRPNIVVKTVAGVEAFSEDNWRTITITKTQSKTNNNLKTGLKSSKIPSGGDGDGYSFSFSLVKGCPRCKESCTDQATGLVTPEPASTLQTYRCMSNGSSDGKSEKVGDDVYFGMNTICHSFNEGGGGERGVEVGDEVWVWEEGVGIYDEDEVAAE